MSDYSELKRLAEGLEAHAEDSFYLPCTIAFERAATPAAVLALIAEVERSQRMLLAACVDMGAIGNALKADMSADGDELLGMVIDLKAQNSRILGWLKDISKTSGDKGAVMGARQLLKEFGNE